MKAGGVGVGRLLETVLASATHGWRGEMVKPDFGPTVSDRRREKASQRD